MLFIILEYLVSVLPMKVKCIVSQERLTGITWQLLNEDEKQEK